MTSMKSLRYLYRIGHGPSSSHSIGPYRAAKYFKKRYPDAISYDVILYGSLALTGRGHLTDKTIAETLAPTSTHIVFDYKTPVPHPNTMDFTLYFEDGHSFTKRIFSIGGGAIKIEGELEEAEEEVYPEKNFAEISALCRKNHWTLVDYVRHYEGDEIFEYLRKVYHQMLQTIENGLKATGELPGTLHVKRRASEFLNTKYENESSVGRGYRTIMAYAFATGEENAAGGIVVTAPTCGSAGTMPALLKYYQDTYNKSEDLVVKALAVGGVFGNIIKQNGSISGAEAGCQAEIGSACSMTAAAYAYLKRLDLDGIECAAEVAMEHSLGSTCDPIGGYVQIPCIERNVLAATRAETAVRLAEYAADTRSISFDTIVQTMIETGRDLKKAYRETSKGGLAKEIRVSKQK